ncbi:AAA family ATPase [Rufibacter roseus]|uniref:AAA family ATPase n=1 Tax=Rufibacter roseus TaxID=1567108 RepID=A0ABW2DK44_9BACT|nr:AAA family ATPase [Rufibacter roseus]
MQLRKATRKQAKLRIGLSAPSGFGKTYSALLMAYGITSDWSKIAIIDTENGSGELYSHLGEYNALPLEAPYSPERYIQAIKACEEAGMEVIIIDSISHEWEGKGGCLEIQEKLGGKYQDWAKVTPRHQAFIESILTSKCHVITTVRRKQDYSMVQEGNKMKVEKAGLKEVTREGFEYELTLNLEIINDKHLARASKDRTGLFVDKPEQVLTVESGKMLREWAESGVDVAALEAAEREKLDSLRKELIEKVDLNLECFGEELAEKSKRAINNMSVEAYPEWLERINNKIAQCELERQKQEESQEAPAEMQVSAEPVKMATTLHKEKILKALNNPAIPRQRKTKELLRINVLTYQEAESLIVELRELIEKIEADQEAAA